MKERIVEFLDEWKYWIMTLTPTEKVLIGFIGVCLGLILLVIF